MSEKQAMWLLAIGFLLFLALLAWINPWYLLPVPVVLYFAIVFDEHDKFSKCNKELEHELKETKEQLDYKCNRISQLLTEKKELRDRVQELEKLVQKLSKDPKEKMREIELNAEREILGNA